MYTLGLRFSTFLGFPSKVKRGHISVDTISVCQSIVAHKLNMIIQHVNSQAIGMYRINYYQDKILEF